MNDNQTDEAPTGVDEGKFSELFQQHMGGEIATEGAEKPDSEPAEPEASQEVLEPEQDTAQGEGVDNPDAGAPQMSLTEAAMWCKRVGLPAHLLKAKSEDEIIALGLEASTLKRQDDREFSRQNRESEAEQSEAAPDSPKAEAGTEAEEGAGNPDEVGDEQFAALVEELGEEAARPLIEDRRALARELADLKAQLAEQQQARQAAETKQVVDKALDGLGSEYPDLSQSEELRSKVIERAAALERADSQRYSGMPPEAALEALLREALLLEAGPPGAKDDVPPTTRIASGPEAGGAGRPEAEANRGEVSERRFRELARKHGVI